MPEDEMPETTVPETSVPETSKTEATGPEASAPGASAPETRVPETSAPDDQRPNRRKVREGVVVSTAMEKTATVAVVERVRHRRYAKIVQRTKRVHAHDERNDLKVGDRVRVSETRPLSKTKRWRVVEVLERAK